MGTKTSQFLYYKFFNYKMKKAISLLIVFIFLGFGINVVKAQSSNNLNILPIDFKNADQSNYSPYIGYRGGQIKFNLNFSGGPTDTDYQIYVYLINEATGKIDFEKIINPTVPTSKWSSTSQVPVVIDIPSDSKASVWTAYRAVVALKKNDKVLVLNNLSKILKSLPHNESPMGDYYKSIDTVYLENGNYIVARILITNSNIYTLPSQNPTTVSAGSNLPITLKFEAKNPEWTYDGIICVGNFFSNTHTTSSKLGVKHNPVITLVPAKVKDVSFGVKDWIVYNTAISNSISDSDTWRGSILLPVSFNIPKNTKPGKYEIHVIPSVSQPFCAIPSMPGNGTSISMLQSTAQPSNLVGTINITNSYINTTVINPPETINNSNNVSTVNVNPTNTNVNSNNQNTNVNVVTNPVVVPENIIPVPKVTINQWNVYSTHVGTNAQATLSSSLVFSTINFSVNFQGGPTDGDKRVFVHFVDSSGNIKFSADLEPSIPSSKWTASSNNWISADVEVPSNIPTGTYNVYAGLYSGSRVELNPGPNVSVDNQKRYKIGTVTISPAPVTVKSSSLVGNAISAAARLFGVSLDK